ncbi:MAG: lipopolysaccharide biosynthesis protein [Phycisphaerae bacterium]
MSERVPISKRLVLVNVASNVVTHAIRVGILLWVLRYLLAVKKIPADEYAIYVVAMAIMQFMPLLTAVLTAGVGRYVTEAYARGDDRAVTEIVSTMGVLHLAAGLFVLLVGGVFAWYVDKVLDVAPGLSWDARLIMGLLMFMFCARVMTAPWGVGFFVRQKFVLLNVLNLGREILRAAFLFVLLFAVSTRVVWLAAAQVGAWVCWMAVATVISCRLVPSLRLRLSAIRWDRARELASFGVWSFIGQIADKIRTSADPLILNKLATAVDVASFHIGSLAFSQVHQGAMLVTGPLVPAFTAMHAKGQTERLRNTYLRGGRIALWVSLFVAVPLIIYRKEVVGLYLMGEYPQAATVMGLLLAIFIPIYGNNMMIHIAIATGEIGQVTWRTLLMQLLNLGLTFWLVWGLGMGAVGSALSTAAVYFLIYPWLLWPVGWRLAGVRPGEWLKETIVPGFLPVIAGGAAWLALQWTVAPSSWGALIACIVAGWAVYGLFLERFGLRAAERSDLQRLFQAVQGLIVKRRSADK